MDTVEKKNRNPKQKKQTDMKSLHQITDNIKRYAAEVRKSPNSCQGTYQLANEIPAAEMVVPNNSRRRIWTLSCQKQHHPFGKLLYF
jgi:hypothetical protein